jgi:hypothetical protein
MSTHEFAALKHELESAPYGYRLDVRQRDFPSAVAGTQPEKRNKAITEE